jgi:hypothetical protein
VRAKLLAVGLLLGVALGVPWFGAAAQTPPSPSPAVKPSPSPAAKPTGTAVPEGLSGDWIQPTLLTIGVVLVAVTGVGWYFSNRAEATPNAEQREDIRRFVERDFARYVARHHVPPGPGVPGAAAAHAVSIAGDEGWRKVFLHHFGLHNELSHFSKQVALEIYTQYVDDAVRRELAAITASSGETTSPPERS